MALQDVTYQNVEINELPAPTILTITDISYPGYEVCELILKQIIVSGEVATMYNS